MGKVYVLHSQYTGNGDAFALYLQYGLRLKNVVIVESGK